MGLLGLIALVVAAGEVTKRARTIPAVNSRAGGRRRRPSFLESSEQSRVLSPWQKTAQRVTKRSSSDGALVEC